MAATIKHIVSELARTVYLLIAPSLDMLLASALVIACIAAATLYFFWESINVRFPRISSRAHDYRWIAGGVLVARVLYAILETCFQYYAWLQGGKYTQIFLEAKLPDVLKKMLGPSFSIFNTRAGYFTYYTFERFWLSVLLTVVVSFLFYYFLRVLKKYRERFFDDGEVELGLIAALISGWPGFVLFLPFAFLLVVVVALIRLLFLKKAYTTLGGPMLLAAGLVLVFGPAGIAFFNLSVLQI